MKLTIKEAYKIATKALPAYRVEVEVSFGQSRWGSNKVKLQWKVSAVHNESSDYISENDELFSIALAKVIAESTRASMKPAEDIEVEQEEDEAIEEETATDDGAVNGPENNAGF